MENSSLHAITYPRCPSRASEHDLPTGILRQDNITWNCYPIRGLWELAISKKTTQNKICLTCNANPAVPRVFFASHHTTFRNSNMSLTISELFIANKMHRLLTAKCNQRLYLHRITAAVITRRNNAVKWKHCNSVA